MIMSGFVRVGSVLSGTLAVETVLVVNPTYIGDENAPANHSLIRAPSLYTSSRVTFTLGALIGLVSLPPHIIDKCQESVCGRA